MIRFLVPTCTYCRKTTLWTLALALMLSASTKIGRADLVTTDWTSFNSNSATGVLDGVPINAAILSGAIVFDSIVQGAFSAPGWQANEPLAPTAEGLGHEGRAGTILEYSFSGSFSYLRFYAANFDSASAATLTANGATSISLLSGSSSISFNPLTGSTGQLISSNFSGNGEGSAVVEMTGAITSFRVDYYSGWGGNWVVNTFATTAVPEPGSLGLAGCLLSGLVFQRARRRLAN